MEISFLFFLSNILQRCDVLTPFIDPFVLEMPKTRKKISPMHPRNNVGYQKANPGSYGTPIKFHTKLGTCSNTQSML